MDGMITGAADTSANAATPGIGHNAPPAAAPINLADYLAPEVVRDQIAIDYAEVLARRDALLASAIRFHDKYPNGPIDDETCGKATDFIKQIKESVKKAEEAHKTAKAPFLNAGRTVDAVLKAETADALSAAADRVNKKVTAYLVEKANRERIEAQKLAAAQAAEAQRLADLAASEQNDQVAANLMDHAENVAAQSEKAAATATSSATDLSRTRGTFGSVASLRDNWTYQVEDLMKLVKAVAAGEQPLAMLLVNDALVRGMIKPKDGMREIPGLKIWNDAKAGVR